MLFATYVRAFGSTARGSVSAESFGASPATLARRVQRHQQFLTLALPRPRRPFHVPLNAALGRPAAGLSRAVDVGRQMQKIQNGNEAQRLQMLFPHAPV